ncbi:hypothetical protein sr15765 [Sporisorium reilianum SRZ2]|uniref:Uncharacterized protein n=1 Tax=Sporisorium reilianum (strain SRZ2) TaxID=999809 RepID=E6ZRJ0_SPORE|nr:hypothetical protein sr15765 [Sporisorium reilianum SRZ2]
MTDIIGILVMFMGYKTIVHARQGNYAAHRTWARFHTYAGFAIPLQRAWQGLLLALAMLIPLLPKSILQRFNYPSSDEAISKAELGSVGLAVFLAGISSAFIVYRDFLAPVNWSTKSMLKFLVGIGPLSSPFDILTFTVNWFSFRLHDPSNAGQVAKFQTHRFLEDCLTQVAIVHVLPTADDVQRRLYQGLF